MMMGSLNHPTVPANVFPWQGSDKGHCDREELLLATTNKLLATTEIKWIVLLRVYRAAGSSPRRLPWRRFAKYMGTGERICVNSRALFIGAIIWSTVIH